MSTALVKSITNKAKLSLNQIIVRTYVDLRFWIKDDVVHSNLMKILSTSRVNNKFLTCEYVDGRFISPWGNTKKDIMTVLKWQIETKFKKKKMSDLSKFLMCLPMKRSKLHITDQPHVTWIGHATCYFQSEGLHFLTDPIFSDSCSPSEFLGPFRTVKPPVDIENLKIDVVLLSHTHYDHLDIPSARRIGNRALWIVPLGVKKQLKEIGITNCKELNWWENHTIKCPKNDKIIDIIFTPTKHWTSRTLFDRNSSLWGSFAVIGPNHRFFFSGDTAYCPIFKTIGDHYGPFDMSAISIGAYKPRWFLQDVHCDPQEALQIHLDLRSKQSLAIHWGTFPLADEDFIEPALELARSRKIANISVDEFFTMAHGETLLFGEKPKFDFATLHPAAYDDYVKDTLKIEENTLIKID